MRTLLVLSIATIGVAPCDAIAAPTWSVTVPLLAADDHEGKDGKESTKGDGKGEKDHDDEHAKDGPQLIPAADLALWSLVTFVVLFAVLAKFAWPAISSGLDTREERIRDDIAKAEQDRVRAAALLAEHEERLKSVEAEIRDMRSEARAAAEQMKSDAVTAGKEEAAALVEKARGEIEQDRRRAEDELKRELADKVVAAAEAVIGRKMNDGDEQRLADEALQQFAGSV